MSEKIKGNPRLKEFLTKEKENNKEVKLTGSPPVQQAWKEYFERKKEKEGRSRARQRISQRISSRLAKVPTPSDYKLPPVMRGIRKIYKMIRKTIRLDIYSDKILQTLPKVMGISQAEFIRRAINVYAGQIMSFLGDKKNE